MKPNPNVYDPGTYPAFNPGQPTVDDSRATQPAVPGQRRGMMLGGVCRGFGITGLVVFVLVVVGTLVYVMIPADDYSRGLAPLAFIFMAGFGSIPVVVVNIIGLFVGFVALAQAEDPADRAYVRRSLLLNAPPLIIVAVVVALIGVLYGVLSLSSTL